MAERCEACGEEIDDVHQNQWCSTTCADAAEVEMALYSPYRLKNLQVEEISLVDKPPHGHPFLTAKAKTSKKRPVPRSG